MDYEEAVNDALFGWSLFTKSNEKPRPLQVTGVEFIAGGDGGSPLDK
jgi:hypothetical protein